MTPLTAGLEGLASRLRRGGRLAAAGAAGAGLCTTLGAGSLLFAEGRWLAWPAWLPVAWWGLAGAVAVGAWGWRRARAPHAASLLEVADAVERERGLRAGALRGLLQVVPAGGALVAHQAAAVQARLGSAPWAPALERRLGRAVAAGLGATGLATLLWAAAAWRAPDGWAALRHPVAAARGTLLPPVHVDGTARDVLRGDTLAVRIAAPGRTQVTLRWHALGEAWRDTVLVVVDDRAGVAIGPVEAPLALLVTDGRAWSDTLAVALRERPYAGDVRLRATYPAYLRRPPEDLPADAVLRLPEGTVLAWTTRTAGLAALALTDGQDTLRAALADGTARGQTVARRGGTWRWLVEPVDADVPPPLTLDVVPDPAPLVRILAPGADTTAAAADTVIIAVRAIDDLAVVSLALRVQVLDAEGRVRDTRRLTLPGAVADVRDGLLDLALATLGAVEGGTVQVVAEARDAAPFGRVGESAPLRLRLPTATERREAAIAAADSAVRAALAASTAQRTLARRTEDAARQRPAAAGAGTPAQRFESQERAQALAAEQRGLTERVQALSERAGDLARELREAGISDSSVQGQLREAQRLLREAMTPELQARLQAVEAQRQAGDPQEALRDLQPEQQQLREALERSTELLKRAALEGTMQALGTEASELAAAQRAYAQDSAPAARPGAARELSSRAEAVQREARTLAERLRQDGAPEARAAVERAAAEAAASRRAMDDAVQAADRQARAAQAREAQAREAQERAEQRPRPRDAADSVARRADADSAQASAGQQAGRRDSASAARASDPTRGADSAARRPPSGGAATTAQQQALRDRSAASGPPKGDDKLPGDLAGPGAPPSPGDGTDPGAAGRAAAERAADAMERAAGAFGAARQQQVDAWKQDLTGALDQSIQEALQLAREQDALRDRAQRGETGGDLRGEQGSLQQGTQQAADRVSAQAKQSALVSPRSQQAMAEARQQVQQAGEQLRGGASGQQVAQSMGDAADALRRAAAAMARDRERAASASSASGLPELMEQMQQMAQQQGALNGSTASLLSQGGLGGMAAAERQEALQALADRQRALARGLQDAADQDRSGRTEQMARDAEQLASSLAAGALDPATVARQQQLFRRLLDAGRALQQDDRDPGTEREARTGSGRGAPPATGAMRGAAAQAVREPTFEELRGLSAEERRIVLEYFRRLNGGR
jgi:hypothetical protein